MGVQAGKSARRARKRAVVGDGLISRVKRDKDVRQLVAAEANDRTVDHHAKIALTAYFIAEKRASSRVTSWKIGLQRKPSSHGRNSNRA